jgi:hypothetical protein
VHHRASATFFTINLTDEAAIRRAIEEDRIPRTLRLDLLRSALAKLDPATAAKLSRERQRGCVVRSPAV